MRDHYLIHGANALKGSLKYIQSSKLPAGPFYDPRSVEIFLGSACVTLTLLSDDAETLALLAQAPAHASKLGRNQAKAFIDEFVKADKALLIAAGMEKKVASYLFRDAQKTLQYLDEQRPLNPSHLRDRVLELREAVCGESNSMKAKRSRDSLLQRCVKVIGGGAIVVTNAAADMLLGGIATALSQAYGGYIAGKGFDG